MRIYCVLSAVSVLVFCSPLAFSDIWQEPKTGMRFVSMAAGSYTQGCGDWTTACDLDETPVRKVTLDAFWIGVTEVTQGQWKQVMGANPSGFPSSDSHPVEKVSWKDVNEFLEKLNALVPGEKFRLPTEAEWEFACRAGGHPLPYGTKDGAIDAKAAYYGQTGNAGTSPVGSFPPNAVGIHDMSGNVAEWTRDLYTPEAYASGDAVNPVLEERGSPVVRGGGWFSKERVQRCSDRFFLYPQKKRDHIGFRLVRQK